jgi:flagellar hook protein FlgE
VDQELGKKTWQYQELYKDLEINENYLNNNNNLEAKYLKGLYKLDKEGYLRDEDGNFIYDYRIEGREDGIEEAAEKAGKKVLKADMDAVKKIIPRDIDFSKDGIELKKH